MPGWWAWITKRMSGLSIPMPKALVATMTGTSPLMNRSWLADRSAALIRPWYEATPKPWPWRYSVSSPTALTVAT